MTANRFDKIHTEKVEIRKVGLTITAVLAILGVFFWWRGRDCYICLFLISFAFLFFTFTAPIALKPVYKAWMILSVILNQIMTGLILSILFYLILTPIGFFGKLFGKNYLNLKFNKHNSYWIPKERKKDDKSKHERQF